MILTGPEISRQVSRQRIQIEPFCAARLNPNSYNFRLSETLRVYDNELLDAAIENPSSEIKIPHDGMLLQPDRIYLGASVEIIGSDHYVPIIRARSSTARLGLFVHVTADLVDLGFFGQITLQLHAVQPVIVYPNVEIGQVTFWHVVGEKVRYTGKYQGASGPLASRSFEDFAPPVRPANHPAVEDA